MEYNWLTFNGVSGPAITPMIARLGSRVRLRIVNIGMDHHPIHLHGHQFVMTGTEGGRAPESTWYAMNTVLWEWRKRGWWSSKRNIPERGWCTAISRTT
jgi:FtsP/CotA-like multicopper oxidase with cupredoxin domain